MSAVRSNLCQPDAWLVVCDVVVRAGADVDPDHLAKILRVVRKA
jgi:hypothetical protein